MYNLAERFATHQLADTDLFTKYNSFQTWYKDGTVRVFISNEEYYKMTDEAKNVFYTPRGKTEKIDYNLIKNHYRLAEKEDNIERSIRRTRKALKDYILNNKKEKSLFVTLTNGDQSVIDDELFSKQIRKKMKNFKSRYGIEYILVPEPHETGRLHFHGILYNVPDEWLSEARSPKTGRLVKTKKGLQVYNLPKFDKNGYTTVTKITDYERSATYMLKYITKELMLEKGCQRYYISSGIEKPIYYNEGCHDLTFYINVCEYMNVLPNGFLIVYKVEEFLKRRFGGNWRYTKEQTENYKNYVMLSDDVPF